MFNPSTDNPKNQGELSALLEYKTRDCAALERAIAVRAWHPSLSGIISAGKRREAEIGRRLEFICRLGIEVGWTLERRPTGSRSALDGARLTPDVPGVYVVCCTLDGGWARDIEIVAAPDSLFDRIGPADGPNDRLKTFRCRLNDGRTTADIVAAIENHPPTWGTLASPAT